MDAPGSWAFLDKQTVDSSDESSEDTSQNQSIGKALIGVGIQPLRAKQEPITSRGAEQGWQPDQQLSNILQAKRGLGLKSGRATTSSTWSLALLFVPHFWDKYFKKLKDC